jgi:CheY-like chemotaxis protein
MPTPGRPRILVVADDDSVRRVLVGALRDEYEVVAVKDRFEALDAALSAGQHYDLIVSTAYRSGMGSDKLLARLRAEHSLVPILHLDDVMGHQHADLSFDALILFIPFSVDALLDHVRRLVRPSASGDR